MTAGDTIVVNENDFGKKANYYDGTDDYMLADAHAVARVAANDTVGTYTAWIYVNDVDNSYAILSAGDNNSADEFLLLTCISGKLQVHLRDAGANQFIVIETTAGISAKTWTHVAVVQNGTRPTLYVNGVASVMTDSTSTDLTMWYDELNLCDKFAIGVLESNGTHTSDMKGAIGQVKYWNLALNADEINIEANEHLSHSTVDQTRLDASLQLNFTMDEDGTTDAGLGADNGTLTGHAYYGGLVSDWSYQVGEDTTGHAAEEINSYPIEDRVQTVIKRGD